MRSHNLLVSYAMKRVCYSVKYILEHSIVNSHVNRVMALCILNTIVLLLHCIPVGPNRSIDPSANSKLNVNMHLYLKTIVN